MIRIPTPHRSLAIGEAFKTLLSTKHLYQSHRLALDFIDRIISEEEFSSKNIRGQIEQETTNGKWKLLIGMENTSIQDPTITFKMPNIETHCHDCKKRQSFTLVDKSEREIRLPEFRHFVPTPQQVYHLSFLCQSCQSATIEFMVARDGLKLTLCGRSPIESVPAPKFIPPSVRDYYSDAMIDHHAGATLEALFMLRTLIEQFWKSQNLMPNAVRPTGDELGDAYNATLPDDFKKRFPSLKDIYAKLSEAIHEADGKDELFQSSLAEIERHFEARRLYGIE